MSGAYYIGWDVGAWNCDKNSKSRDALVILNVEANVTGTLWRGNLRETINDSKNTYEFISALFKLCDVVKIGNSIVTMAIDAPLGFSEGFRKLLAGNYAVEEINKHPTNPYLFRATERYLFKKGLKPLSSVKDMIGSQTTKAMHVLAKFAPNIVSCGVWADNEGKLKVIETYPASCRDLKLKNSVKKFKYQDSIDALICAEIAYTFQSNGNKLVGPTDEISKEEGWIWTLDKNILTTI